MICIALRRPIGLTAFFLRALLYKDFVPDVPAAVGVGLTDTSDTFACYLFCAVVFGLAISVGLLCGGGKKYIALLNGFRLRRGLYRKIRL